MIYALLLVVIVLFCALFVSAINTVAADKAGVSKKELQTTKKQLGVARNTLTGIASNRSGNPMFEAQDALHIIEELGAKEIQ